MNTNNYHTESSVLHQMTQKMTKSQMLSVHATRRILAPYVKARRKPVVEVEENKHFQYFAQRKPSILMQVMAKWCVAADLIDVLNETGLVLKQSTRSKEVRIYMVDDTLDEIYRVTNNYEVNELRVSYKIQTGSSVAAHVAYTKEMIKINDLLADIRFPEGLGNYELTVNAVLCVPVLTLENECIALFELHRDIDDKIYRNRDLRLCVAMCTWIGIANYRNHQRLTLLKQQELNEYLLHLTECYFADNMLLDKLIAEVVKFAKMALNAEHGSFYMIKPESDDKYAYFYEEDNNNTEIFNKKTIEMKDNVVGLINHVAQKGQIINIKNAFDDPRVQQNHPYIIQSILCIPIKCVDKVLGIMQIVNKGKDVFFTKSDELLSYTFSLHCGFVLQYARLHEKMIKMNGLNHVYVEILAGQMQPCIHDLHYITCQLQIPSIPEEFHQFDFYIEEHDTEIPLLIIYMFQTLTENRFQNDKVLGKFIYMVQKCYRDIPYHNFLHAFHVCHSMYNMLLRNLEHFTQMEIIALMIAALCHDVDHYGETNSFLAGSNKSIGHLYDHCSLEYHHFHVTKLIIKFLRLFPSLKESEHCEFFQEIKFLILATNLSNHFLRLNKLKELYHNKTFDFSDVGHKALVKSVMMTLADLYGSYKPFKIAKLISDKQYEEYYKQGDQEKEMGVCPLPIMDRDMTEDVASDQIQFLTVVAIPCAKLIMKLFPNCEYMFLEALKLRESWKEVRDIQGHRLWTIEDSLPKPRFS